MSALQDWEGNTERRLGIVEQKVDKILDPETGIYPKLLKMEARIKGYVITILIAILGTGALNYWAHGGK